MIQLSSAERVELRARAQALQPVVSVAGKGLTPAVVAEIDRALKAHELIKIRTYGHERGQRELLMSEICATLECVAVQHIGNLLVVFRERPHDNPVAAKPMRPSAGRLTKKQQAAGTASAKPMPRRLTQGSAPATPQRRATPNPPRRANNVRGR